MENAVKTQNKYQVSIDLLNDAVGKEIATSLQYMYFHTHFEDDRYQYLSKIMREISIAEMRHIEEFSDRILFLQGDVDMNASFRTRQVTDVKDMLRLALQLEQSTIVKERGTVYFKVSPQQGPQTLPGRALPRQRGFCQEVDRLAPAAVTKWIWAGWSGWGGGQGS